MIGQIASTGTPTVPVLFVEDCFVDFDVKIVTEGIFGHALVPVWMLAWEGKLHWLQNKPNIRNSLAPNLGNTAKVDSVLEGYFRQYEVEVSLVLKTAEVTGSSSVIACTSFARLPRLSLQAGDIIASRLLLELRVVKTRPRTWVSDLQAVF